MLLGNIFDSVIQTIQTVLSQQQMGRNIAWVLTALFRNYKALDNTERITSAFHLGSWRLTDGWNLKHHKTTEWLGLTPLSLICCRLIISTILNNKTMYSEILDVRVSCHESFFFFFFCGWPCLNPSNTVW